jgi:hypothetical protein
MRTLDVPWSTNTSLLHHHFQGICSQTTRIELALPTSISTIPLRRLKLYQFSIQLPYILLLKRLARASRLFLMTEFDLQGASCAIGGIESSVYFRTGVRLVYANWLASWSIAIV